MHARTLAVAVVGDDDLLAGLHGWTDPVGRISIRRID